LPERAAALLLNDVLLPRLQAELRILRLGRRSLILLSLLEFLVFDVGVGARVAVVIEEIFDVVLTNRRRLVFVRNWSGGSSWTAASALSRPTQQGGTRARLARYLVAISLSLWSFSKGLCDRALKVFVVRLAIHGSLLAI